MTTFEFIELSKKSMSDAKMYYNFYKEAYEEDISLVETLKTILRDNGGHYKFSIHKPPIEILCYDDDDIYDRLYIKRLRSRLERNMWSMVYRYGDYEKQIGFKYKNLFPNEFSKYKEQCAYYRLSKVIIENDNLVFIGLPIVPDNEDVPRGFLLRPKELRKVSISQSQFKSIATTIIDDLKNK